MREDIETGDALVVEGHLESIDLVLQASCSKLGVHGYNSGNGRTPWNCIWLWM